jgi:FixJ family two-component response regulator
MPGMGGKRCLEELRHLDAEVRVIVASGYSENGMVKEVMDQGAVDYLPKPYRLSELLQKVHDCLSPGAGES